MNIQLRVESAYGRELRYVEDQIQADALLVLTRTRTLTPEHMTALLVLGHSFTEVRALGRKVAGA